MVISWAQFVPGPGYKIVHVLFKYLLKLPFYGNLTNPWLDCIQNIFNSCGVPNICLEQGLNLNIK